MNLPMNYSRRLPLLRTHVALAVIAIAAGPLQAQSVAPVAPETLSKYDANKNGVLDPEERAAMTADETKASEEVVTLSPFEVKAETMGYFQSNSMSGTRLNSKIEDLGQSITVMTKDQMTDFAMLDINDVFDYMANTEGANTYSAFEVDRTGAVTDNVSLDPNNANRVRGIGSANIAFNNIAMTGRVPVDPLWIESVELSRGPNANIFGLGNSSGTVNQVPATANLSRDFTRIEARGDSYGGWRGTLDLNQTLIPNKFAVRASLGHQHNAFIRKPSGEDQRRLSLQAKVRPFQGTTLSLSWYNYRNASQRPNFTTPRDNISSWIAAGRPGWDPSTRQVILNGVAHGQGTGGVLVPGSTTPVTTLPTYFVGNDNRSMFRIGAPGEAPYWSTPQSTNAATPFSNTTGPRFVQTAPVANYGTSQPLFASYAALSDKSIYNWEEVSLMSANKAWDDVDTYLAQLDQLFFNTPRHGLAIQLTALREDAKRLENLPLGPASVNGVVGNLLVDPNIKNLDGSPNPYFGRPYLKTTEPFLRDRPMLWDTYRAQGVYRFDFTTFKGPVKWLGQHQLLGYYEYKDQRTRHFAWRHTPTNLNDPGLTQQLIRTNQAGIPLANRTTAGQYVASNNVMRVYEQYYVGSSPNGVVEYGPSFFPEGATLPFVWGTTGNWHYDPVTIDWTPSPDGSLGGGSNQQVLVKTRGGTIQSTFLSGRIVTTLGQREDTVMSRNAVNSTLTSDLTAYDWELTNRWQDGSTWRKASGETKTTQVVVRPFMNLPFINSRMNSGNSFTQFFAEALNGLSLSYNKSDNFIPQGPAVDLFLQPLPNQTGSSKDMGLWLSLFDNRLSIRYNHYETNQINLRNGDIATIAQRVLRADGLNAADRWALQDRARDWITQANPTWTTAQIDQEIAKTMGLPADTISALEAAIQGGTLSATQDMVSKGDELEINYNPTRSWTINASVTKTEAVNQNAGNTIEEWINQRMPFWEKIEDPRFTRDTRDASGNLVAANLPVGATGHLLWRYIAGSYFQTNYGYDTNNSAATNYASFVEGPLAVYRQLEGRPRPQSPRYTAKFSTRYQLSGLFENKILKNMTVGGAVRWTDKKAIGFYGVQSLPARITALDPNRPIYTPADAAIDMFVGYKTRLWNNRIRANFQLNVRNVQEKGGGLLATAVFPDGTPLAYRIMDPRQFILSASFEL